VYLVFDTTHLKGEDFKNTRLRACRLRYNWHGPGFSKGRSLGESPKRVLGYLAYPLNTKFLTCNTLFKCLCVIEKTRPPAGGEFGGSIYK
jgi:hypothetical protein